ncbi:MAG: hypothetical protein BMS9Abin05_1242 [Rhodothermia bacterium]|nr:MAG: hypothetical protein BMS9Abin05_1242 [Rhodothermia bacterium]
MRNYFEFLPVLLLFVAFAGCDTAPGVVETENRSPVLSGLFFSPSSVLLDELPAGSIQAGIARFMLNVAVDVADADGDLDRIFFLVVSPIPGRDPAASEEIVVAENGHVALDINLQIPVAEIGNYTVQVFASDQAGSLGNQVVGTLIVDAISEPPQIDAIDIPDRVTLPGPSEPAIQVPIIAHVSDPDGLANILSVQVEVNGKSTLQLCDDGGGANCNAGFPNSGDVTAGDGLFTLTIELDSSNTPGDNIFVFKAIDRAGLESETVTKIIVVE